METKYSRKVIDGWVWVDWVDVLGNKWHNSMPESLYNSFVSQSGVDVTRVTYPLEG